MIPRGEFTSQMRSGRILDYAYPDPSMIDIEDIAFSLFRHPRFCGQLETNFTVGQHSILTFLIAGERCPEALMHDSAEAYTADVPSPLKRLIGQAFKDLEIPLEQAIAERFGLRYPWPAEVKKFDRIAQSIEATLFMSRPPQPWLVDDGFRMTDRYRGLARIALESGPEDFIELCDLHIMRDREPVTDATSIRVLG